MTRNSLRPLGLSKLDHVTELILCVLQRPIFHPRTIAAQFWPVKLDITLVLLPLHSLDSLAVRETGQ
jgi:hypothetical protein